MNKTRPTRNETTVWVSRATWEKIDLLKQMTRIPKTALLDEAVDYLIKKYSGTSAEPTSQS